MTISEIRDEAGLYGLRKEWNLLLQASAANTVFLTWEWMSAWWRSYGCPGQLRILAAHDGGVLRAIAPLRMTEVKRYGLKQPALAFAGDGSNDSEYLDFIVERGFEKRALAAFQTYLANDFRRRTALTLNELPGNSPTLPLLQDWFSDEPRLIMLSTSPCAVAPLPATWEEYLSSLKPRFRTKVRSILRATVARSEIRFGFCDTGDSAQRLLPELFDLHRRRWAADGKPGVFGWPAKRQFYSEVSTLLLERGWLRFSWLAWNERILACQYGFAYDGVYFHLQEGYEPVSEHWNLGIALRAWTIREFIGAGIREYDFLGGIGRHKRDWGAVEKTSTRVVMTRRTSVSRGVFELPAAEVQARESVRRFIPQAVLDFRKSALERKAAIASGTTPADRSNTASAIRRIAAHAYFNLGIAAASRPLQRRYRMNLGRGPGRLSLSRRAEPSARILCYHRINEEGDPFSPAVSTRLFEDEVRLLSGHYRFVTISDLIAHLESDSSESVLAITFDDGYQDNYWNAYPILQKYRIPATVFLTTGPIDSRETLWFERLAQATRRTTAEYIDLEIDIPRRIWLRSDQERLDANGTVFGLLRALPDSGRQFWLANIMAQLKGPEPADFSDRMLTWDQVRIMARDGIEFGGHTVTHPFVSRLTEERLAWEVGECKRRAEEEIQKPVHYFAYPNGREQDFAIWNKAVLTSAGYSAAVTTIWGVNDRRTDRMEMHRSGPWEEDAAMFASKLDWYQFTEQ